MEKTKYYCEKCDFSAAKLCHWKEHISTKKHAKQIFPAEEFYCQACDVKCCHKSLMDRHKKTKKHIEAAKISGHTENKYLEIINQLLLDNKRSNNDNNELRNFIIEQSKTIEKVLEKNTEVVSKAMDSAKPNNTTITNNNQRFNINLFLNDQCKDAINFSDFVNNIQITYEDLENNAHLGFVNGISKIFLDNLKQLDVNERPIHCTDVKRETMYIKDENRWTKQIDDEKLQKAIQTVSYRGMGKLAEWKQENPDYKDCNSDFSQKCLDIQLQTLAGSEREVYYPKVIHVLARETAVDK
jgi:hypothetical protein